MDKINFMLRMLRAAGLIFCFNAYVFASDVSVKLSPEQTVLKNNFVKLVMDTHAGKWSAYTREGKTIILNAYSGGVYDKSKSFSSMDGYKRSVETRDVNDSLGAGKEVQIEFTGLPEHPSFSVLFTLYEGKRFFVVQTVLKNSFKKAIRVNKLFPAIVASDQKGGVYLGKDPAQGRILDNGHDMYFDFDVRMLSGKEYTLSNWNAAIYDEASGKSLVSGFLTAGASFPLIHISYEPKKAAALGDGRKGFTAFFGECRYEPYKILSPESELFSEKLFVDFSETSPLDGLERYADAVAKENNLKVWKGGVPVSWNSWGTQYHTNISEDIILKNLDAAEKKFKKFGLNYFVIDDGWQKAYGDWRPNSKFPNGMKWLLDEIKKRGFKAGFWTSSFVVDTGSQLYKDHPDWMLEKDALGRQMISADKVVLDMSNPSVQRWLEDEIQLYVKEWGAQWLKEDFNYYLFGSRGFSDPTLTKVEVYRKGWEIIKRTAGEETFILGVGPLAPHVGLVDGMRISLDNHPKWGGTGRIDEYGLLPTMRNLIRRYYLTGNVWVNHPDLVFLSVPATQKRWNLPAGLTSDEIKFEVSAFGFSGGIFKLGDAFVDMTEQHVDMISKIIPAYGVAARPVDLFTSKSMFPEVWDLRVIKDFGTWHAVGLFNWGLDGEKTKSITLNFQDLGFPATKPLLLYDFWERKFLGVFTKSASFNVPPMGVKVLFVHEKKEHPWLIGTNRHITGGATDIENVSWNKETKALSAALTCVPSFPYELTVWKPKGFGPPSLHTEGATETSVGISVPKKGKKISQSLKSASDIISVYFKCAEEKMKFDLWFSS